MRGSLETRFWSKVAKSDSCWRWVGGLNNYRYGNFGVLVGGRWIIQKAHRVSWELTNGLIPPDLYVCHHCDIPACVNPSHLFVGTAADNYTDMVAKGRVSKGARHSDAIRLGRMAAAVRE